MSDVKTEVIMTIQNSWDVEAKVVTLEVKADTEEELFVKLFRDFFNRYKYANSIMLELPDKELAKRYGAYFSDVNNYAEAGGDMW